ncbi:MAG: prolyl oligopeptidase family serine peptidase [Simkaniaceae bacterium]|nr:prolyl oligopeptidase family serine peptidase [Candidatus Sacchlamyda saccharinae]
MMEVIQLRSDIEVAHIGPSFDKGRLPSVFYFALSAEESLNLDPYNQPAVYLANKGVRVFSLNLPAHGPNLIATDAIRVWAEEFRQGKDPLAPFLKNARFAIEALIEKGLITSEKIGFMGLSRGGLISSLVATEFDVCAILGFAPMTVLSYAKEFASEDEAKDYSLFNHIDTLCKKSIRFYMGNRDTRVGTDKCYELALQLANRAYEKGSRSPPIELIVAPSIGHMGHGTPKATFEAGADWLGRKLGAIR